MVNNGPEEIKSVMGEAVNMVHFIKSRPLKQAFPPRCVRGWWQLTTPSLLLQTEGRWLSWRKVLSRIFCKEKSYNSICIFHNESQHVKFLKDRKKLADMADIFEQSNEMNLRMQGLSEYALICADKLNGCKKKNQL